MTSTGSSTPDRPRNRVGRPKAADKELIEKRRRIIGQWRIVQGLTEHQIHEKLTTLDPPIYVHLETVKRDIAVVRQRFANYYGNATEFDPVSEVAELIARYKYMALKSIRLSQATTNAGDIVAFFRAAITAQKELAELFFNTGLVDRKLGSLFLYGKRFESDEQEAKRIPSGVELQKLYDSIHVTDAEIISEAESAWLHGDMAAAESHDPKALPPASED